ncbi:MAG: hypothetical protein JXD21_08100 [Candidatus Omnitrophica bacterium]|nr:hypothetical protein [Candidatus Omnitrophota bacterium]
MQKTSKKNNILIGVCGGIAAYKACELVRILKKEGYPVKVVMTDAATRFVTPLTFQTLSENPVYLDMWQFQKDEESTVASHQSPEKKEEKKRVQHISLSQWTDFCVIAPASANTLSKIAQGICDNLLTTVVCALDEKTKVVFAPAMNENMWKNPIIQQNVKKLTGLKKYEILDPGRGELACGVYGQGRMPEAKDIFNRIKKLLPLKRKR